MYGGQQGLGTKRPIPALHRSSTRGGARGPLKARGRTGSLSSASSLSTELSDNELFDDALVLW